MIKRFNEYEKLDEGWKNEVSSLALMVFLLFNNIRSDAPIKYDRAFFDRYVKSMNIANNDQLVQEVIRDFKAKIANDPKILNKQEVYATIDSTPIIFRNNDEIMYSLYKQAKGKGTASPSSWCSTLTKTNPNDSTEKAKSVIFLAKNAPYSEILHELSHAIETVVKVDPNITKMFNFHYNYEQQQFMYLMMNNEDYSMTRPVSQEHILYLNNPSEVFSRLNNLKMFLFKNKILKSPNEDITELIMMNLITGDVYRRLSEKAKKEFVHSDFMEILIFLDIKKSAKINQYVEEVRKQKKNLT